jgi:hypothetical protein
VIVTVSILVAVLGIVGALVYARLRHRPKKESDELSARFDDLSEAERCDFVFAIAALDDSSSTRLLERALDDPCEAVALAAAHALASVGGSATLQRFFAQRGARAERIARSLELLA